MINIQVKQLLAFILVVAISIAGFISCGGDNPTQPSSSIEVPDTPSNNGELTNRNLTTNIPIYPFNKKFDIVEDMPNELDIQEWLNKQSWTKYDTTIELNGKNKTYSIVFPWANQIGIYDEYNGNSESDYTWGYSSGHKIAFFLGSDCVQFSGKDTVIINKYHMMSRLEKYGRDSKGSIKEKEFMNRSYLYDKDANNNTREEDFYDVALPRYLKLTSEGLLMIYYTYNSKNGAIVDNQTALFKIN